MNQNISLAFVRWRVGRGGDKINFDKSIENYTHFVREKLKLLFFFYTCTLTDVLLGCSRNGFLREIVLLPSHIIIPYNYAQKLCINKNIRARVKTLNL